MLKLNLNIDHVATLRQARRADEPDPVWAATQAELAGADGITFHLREDRRHINDRDAEVLKQVVATKLNMEMSTDAGIVKIAMRLKPDQVTLVPERRQELTTEGGLDVPRSAKRLKPLVKRLKGAGIATSAFIEPAEKQIQAAAECGFDAVELWTGGYAHAKTPRSRSKALDALVEGVDRAHDFGLDVHAGHGLTYRNVAPVAWIPGITDFNIGHSIIARSVLVGIREAVQEMRRLLETASHHHVAIVEADDLLPSR